LMLDCRAQVCAAWRMTLSHFPFRFAFLLKVDCRLLVTPPPRLVPSRA